MSAIRAVSVASERFEPPCAQDAAYAPLVAVRPPSPSAPRLAALDADATGGVPADLAAIWRLLLDGRGVIRDVFYSPTRWLAIYSAPPTDAPARSVSRRVRRLFDALLSGERQKNAAFEHGLCASTISINAHRGLEQLGVFRTPCKAPPVLALLARAGRGLASPSARTCSVSVGGEKYEVLSVERPELLLLRTLPPAEFHVLCRLVEGATYERIALERGTSQRTIANQVRSVFQRLAVSGRAELIVRLLELAAAASAPVAPTCAARESCSETA